ncbi:hypothetical protein M23134_03933 [Microscilla marina ATCC 23134]|uniref:Uncharacterized protein n=2 Tax=Microscilla marina TaxID=1027 RepID=A1ZMK1_MICM2|nr:hypothetical protein M23134_03933 [Microscilla marina ATCC 23134]
MPQLTHDQMPLRIDEALKEKRDPEQVAARKAEREEIVKQYNEQQAQAKAKAQTTETVTEIKKPNLKTLMSKYQGVALVHRVFAHYRVEMGKAKMPASDKQILAQICRDFHLKAVEGGNRLTAMPGASKAALAFGSTFNKLRRKHARRYQQQVLVKQQAYTKQINEEEKQRLVADMQRHNQKERKTKSNPMDKKKVAPENEYQKENSFLKNWGVYITGNGQFNVIAGMKGSAKGSFDMKAFAKYAGIAFEGGKLKLTLGVVKKFYKALDTVLKSKKQLDALKLADGVARGLKHLQSADGKSKQLGDNIRSLTGIKKGLDEMVMDVVGNLAEQLSGHKKEAEKKSITTSFNQLLNKYQLPSLDHDLYASISIKNLQTKEIRRQPKFKPSKKHPGYYVNMDSFGKYYDDAAPLTTFWKVGANKEMEHVGQLNQYKK